MNNGNSDQSALFDRTLDIMQELYNKMSTAEAEGGWNDHFGLFSIFAELGRTLVEADRCSFWKWDKINHKLITNAAVGTDQIIIDENTGLVGRAIREKKPIVTNDPYNCPDFNSSVDKSTGYTTKSILVIPCFNCKGEMIGAYQAINKLDDKGFDVERDTRRLSLAAVVCDTFLDDSQTDKLTKLRNRMGLHSDYKSKYLKLMTSTKDEKISVSIIMCDIDHFKRVNDTYGHNAGDAVLEHVARILKDSVRDTDNVYRWGGEEFIIFLAKADLLQSAEVAERIKEAISYGDISENAEYDEARNEQARLEDEIKRLEGLNEAAKTSILKIVNEKGIVNAKFQRLDERMEQANIRKAELDQRFLKIKSEEEEKQKALDEYRKQLEEASSRIVELENERNDLRGEIRDVTSNIEDAQRESIELNGRYQKTETKLESLKIMTERYEGYGNSIKKVMEQRFNYSGIIGVVADIIKVDKKYETAIETALGGNIQNIVTNDENTAKEMIEFLKKNKLGRATFLPLSSVKPGPGIKDESVLEEKGVLGEAHTLVNVDKKYSDIVKYLLHRMIVVDHIDNAIALAKHADRSLQIVTLEGEFLKPGGSMTGGSFKNSSNLLGRRREVESLEAELLKISKEGEKLIDKIAGLEKQKNSLEQKAESLENRIKSINILLRKKNSAQIFISGSVPEPSTHLQKSVVCTSISTVVACHQPF